MKIITKIFLITVVCFIFSDVANAQTGVLYCNERNTLRDTKYFPNNFVNKRDTNGREIKLLKWNNFLGNDLGTYKLIMTSNSPFYADVYHKPKNSRRWNKSGRNASYVRGRNSNYYLFERTFYVNNSFSDGQNIVIYAFPKTQRGSVSAAWYTTNCKKNNSRRTTPRRTAQCKWKYYGGNNVYGLGGNYYCDCRGKKYDTKKIYTRKQQEDAVRACGRLPSGSSELFMPQLKNNFLDWKRESNLLVGKKVFDTDS